MISSTFAAAAAGATIVVVVVVVVVYLRSLIYDFRADSAGGGIVVGTAKREENQGAGSGRIIRVARE